MPIKDRETFIALLHKLGHPEDPEALKAAREIAHRMKEAGADWAALLSPTGVVHAQMDEDADEAGPADAGPGDEAPAPAGDAASDLAAVERLLKGFELSADTRDMLEDFKEDIKQGAFSPADRRYVQSLEARLKGAKKK